MGDEQILDPGPFEAILQAEAGGEAPAAEAPAGDSAAPAAEPIFRGIQRNISDPAELAQYALELERKSLEQEARLSGFSSFTQPPAAAQAAPSSMHGLDSAKIAEEFILNPGGAIDKIIAHVKSSVLGDVSQQTGRTEFFRSFYDENEDLRNAEDLVDLSVSRNADKWKSIPVDQAKKLLAQDVRQRISALRGVAPAGGTPLSTKPAHALPSGGNPAPKVPAAAPRATTFLDEFKAQRAKHVKRA